MIRTTMMAMVTALLLGTVAGGLVTPAEACVGRTLLVGSKGTVQQDLLAQILALLITERTGTTVKVVRYDSTAAIHAALVKADLDMYVEYTGVGLVEVLQEQPLTDSAQVFGRVKERYNQELNLVWLSPLGLELAAKPAPGVPTQAAPVVRKDTLKKFPALARLIDKLGGTLDDAAMAALEQQAKTGNVRDVARSWLKDRKLI